MPQSLRWGDGVCVAATASIIDSKFKCVRDSKIIGVVAVKLNIQASTAIIGNNILYLKMNV